MVIVEDSQYGRLLAAELHTAVGIGQREVHCLVGLFERVSKKGDADDLLPCLTIGEVNDGRGGGVVSARGRGAIAASDSNAPLALTPLSPAHGHACPQATTNLWFAKRRRRKVHSPARRARTAGAGAGDIPHWHVYQEIRGRGLDTRCVDDYPVGVRRIAEEGAGVALPLSMIDGVAQ